MSTNRGVATENTVTPASSARTASEYAPDSTVPWVAITPTLRLRVALTAARAPGSTTPITGTSNVRCAAARPAAVPVLQAMTSSFTRRCDSHVPICRTKSRTSESGRGPYGHRAVSPTYRTDS